MDHGSWGWTDQKSHIGRKFTRKTKDLTTADQNLAKHAQWDFWKLLQFSQILQLELVVLGEQQCSMIPL
jgi:hypothetical protein